MRYSYSIFLLTICCVHAALVRAQPDTLNAGITRISSSGEYVVPIAVWYPTTAREIEWGAGPYTINATPDAPLAEGRHPLVILSHGSGGGEFGHADLAQTLARHGYIVAAPRHLGDSYDRPEGRGTAIQLLGRPWQIVATLDAVLADKRLAGSIDPARIGMAGFSAGGYTTLVMAGAKPDLALHRNYCNAHPDDDALCKLSPQAQAAFTMPGWQLPVDKRIRAAVAMAPLSVVFDANGVKDIAIPLKIYKASDDQELRNPWNTDHLLSVLPGSVERGEVPGGHFVFLAPCSAMLKTSAPSICTDAPEINRAAQHEKLNAEIVDFFDRSLKLQ